MLRLSDVTLARGAKRLIEHASLAVHAGQHVGVVGANGAGKSSLFALLRGELLPEAGDVDLPASWVVAHVAQETGATDAPAIEWVLDGDRGLRDVQHALSRAEHEARSRPDQGGHALAELHHRFEEIGGYAARSRAAALLSGLGFGTARHDDPVSSFSGGWRMRLNLAQALMCRSDLLLLDEPTNHLDLDAVLWLEDWLSRYRGTLLLITHDRDFLDAVVDAIVHFDRGTLRLYRGNYSQFEREHAAQLALQQATHEQQQRRIAHLQSFVDRFRAKATKARQAQSRIKALERMERIAAAHVDSPFSFSFAPVDTGARQLVRLERATIGYGDAPVLQDIEWSVLSGDRIGLLGPNGAGKSTLLKAIAGVIGVGAMGKRHTAQNLRIGYFAQHQLDQLRGEETPLWHLAHAAAMTSGSAAEREREATEQALRDFLGGFDFRGDMVNARVGALSGGEKARLTLALIVWQRPNLLLLDEPTNHLDIEMREALAEALQDYAGALIVVAHDRHLLRATTDALWLVTDGRVQPFDGDLDDYRSWVLSAAQRMATEPPRNDAPPSRREERRLDAERRQALHARRKPLTERLSRVEASIAALASEKQDLEQWLASEDAYIDANRELLKSRIARQGDLTWELARLETEWLEISEALEQER